MKILYSDKDIVALIKPVGLDSEREVPDKLESQLGGEFFTVHRLDKNVGGVMVYARNRITAAALSKTIQQGEMVKEYVALVHGIPPENGVLEDLLFKDSKKNKVFVVKRERKGVKQAKLEYRLIKTYEETSLVRIRLYTGRSHQIRVQFASRGFPLVGDRKYGARDKSKAPMLYSCKITFPYKNKTVSFESMPDWAENVIG